MSPTQLSMDDCVKNFCLENDCEAESETVVSIAAAHDVSPRLKHWLALATLLVAASPAQAQSVWSTSLNVGATAVSQTVTVTATATGSVVAPVKVLTLGASGLDFIDKGGGCTTADFTATGQSCTETVTFSPTLPGQRLGAVVLLDGSGNLLGTSLLSGTGLGGLGVFVPGTIQTVAGNGGFTTEQDGILAITADLYLPSSVAIDGAGNIYIADSNHNRVRMVCASATSPIKGVTCPGAGIIVTVAGNGDPYDYGDTGPSLLAELSSPSGVALDGAGNLYIADSANNAIRKVTAATGIITTVAGSGSGCGGETDTIGDNCAADSATLNAPQGITVDVSGNLFIADTYNHRIRMVDVSTGFISTVAGNGTGGYNSDGIAATSAELNLPYAVAFDAAGDMYIPDSGNNRVRKVAAPATTGSSNITTIAGTGTPGYSADNIAATTAKLNSPFGVAIDPAGNLYIADTQNYRVRKVSFSSQIISTIAGDGTTTTITGTGVATAADGDGGSALQAGLNVPYALSLDGMGDLFIADYFDQRIREIQSNLVTLDYTTPIRQGSVSATQNQTVENDGNASLVWSVVAPESYDGYVNAEVAASSTCIAGNTENEDADCVVGAIFAPSSSLAFATGVTTESITGIIDVGQTGDTANAPLVIQLDGTADVVNSTTVTVTSTPNPSNYTKSVTFTATVITGVGTGNLTGTVSFYDGATLLKSGVALNSAGTDVTATYITAALAVGLHNITAYYDNTNDPAHYSSTSPIYQQTVLEATTTSLSANPASPSPLGESVTFTATVTATNGGGVTLDGSVSFTNTTTGAPLCTDVTLVLSGTSTMTGTAQCTTTTTALVQGQNYIEAAYSGDAAIYIGASTWTQDQDVQAAPTVTVTTSGSPSYYGTSVLFTATVAPPTGYTITPTGTVNFYSGTTLIGAGTRVGTTDQWTFTTATLSVGSHNITADYSGDMNYAATISPAIIQVVDQTVTSTTITSITPNPGIAGAPETINVTVTVTDGVSTLTGGTVTFTDTFGETLPSATLTAAGTATITPTLAPGAHSIVATYTGDTDNGQSSSAAYALTVDLATTSTAVTSTPNPAVYLAPITFSATVTGNGGVPGGSVSFYAYSAATGTVLLGSGTLDSTGKTSVQYSALPVGSYTITADYSGDVNDQLNVGTEAATQVVGTIPTVTDLGSATTTGATAQLILVASVVNSGGTGLLPTGTVTFYECSGTTASTCTTEIGAATLDTTAVATLVPNLNAGTYTVEAVYGGDTDHTGSTSTLISAAMPSYGFDLTVTPSSLTIPTTKNATVTVTLTSNNGFSDTIGLGCATLPAGVTCHFASDSAALTANGTQSVQLTIDTNNPLSGGSTTMNRQTGRERFALAGVFLPFSLLLGCVAWRFRRRNAALMSVVLAFAFSGALLLISGCTGFTQSSAAPGTYVIQVTGTGASSTITHYQNVTLTITN